MYKHSIFIKTRKLTLVQDCYLKWTFFWYSPVFSLMSFFFFSILSRFLHCIQLSVLIFGLLLSMIAPQSLCLWWPWHFWRVLVGYFVEMSLNLSLPDVLMIRIRLHILKIEQQRHVPSWMHIKGFIMFPCLTTVDANHDHLAKVVSVKFLHFKYLRRYLQTTYANILFFLKLFSPGNLSIQACVYKTFFFFS